MNPQLEYIFFVVRGIFAERRPEPLYLNDRPCESLMKEYDCRHSCKLTSLSFLNVYCEMQYLLTKTTRIG